MDFILKIKLRKLYTCIDSIMITIVPPFPISCHRALVRSGVCKCHCIHCICFHATTSKMEIYLDRLSFTAVKCVLSSLTSFTCADQNKPPLCRHLCWSLDATTGLSLFCGRRRVIKSVRKVREVPVIVTSQRMQTFVIRIEAIS